MSDEYNTIDGLLLLLSERKPNGCYYDQRYHAALTALVAERDALIADRTALIAECDGLRSEREIYWGINDEQIAELAAMCQQRDEAHGLIRNWQTDLIRVINDSALAYVPVATYDMNEADKRAFLAATRKEGGGA